MDPQLEAHYWLHFENRFLTLRREEFQGWFVDILGWAFPGDFIATRQGTTKGGGDRSCDGFRTSTGTVYAVYAPRTFSLSELNAKIPEDFKGALKEFGDRMKEWVFVHNEPDERISADTILALADLKTAHPAVRIESHIGKRELWEIVRTLDPQKLHSWFAEPPSSSQMDRLGMADLQPVLRFFEQQQVPLNTPTQAPNKRKLEHNRLSMTAAEFLRLGRRRELLVEEYFNGCSNVMMGEAIAQGFRDRYRRMRCNHWESEAIFTELYGFAGGFHFLPHMQQAAVWAILSYYFERCDIFENPPEETL